MERTEILDLMGTLKLYGMRMAYDGVMAAGIKRRHELPRWLHRYNWHRPHGSIGSKAPISRLGLTGNNLLRLHS